MCASLRESVLPRSGKASHHAGQGRGTETSGWCWIKPAHDDDNNGNGNAHLDGDLGEDDFSSRSEVFAWEVRI